jgi:hypothetical protein
MAFKFSRHKWHHVTGAVSLVILTIVLVLAFLVNAYWSPILSSKIKDVVLKSTDSLYHVDFSSAELHVLRGTIILNNVTLVADTAVYNRKKLRHLAPNNLISLKIKKLTLAQIHPFTLYLHHRLNIGEVILKRPEINISYQLNHTKDTTVKDNRTAWQKISKSLHSIHVGSILLGDVKFRYEDYSGHKVAISQLKEMNVTATDLLIDSASQFDKSRLVYCRDVIAQLNNYSGKTASGLYSYTIKSLALSTQKSQLTINGMVLKPVKPDEFFAKSHNDRYSVRLDTLQLNNFDFLTYHKYRTLSASCMLLNSGTVMIYSNPKPSTDKSDRVRTFPNVGLFKIYADLKLDTILLNRINIGYTELNIKSHQVGTIMFNNTSGRFLNVSTDRAALLKKPDCNIQLTTFFMNRGKLNVAFNFNLVDAANSFNYKGTLGAMDLQAINPAVMPLAMVKITNGSLKQFDFDINADNKTAHGSVRMLYNNVKVNLLQPDTVNDKLKHKPIASLFANIFILKHDNPDVPGGIPRTFYVNNNRKPETPFFQFVWHTLLEGLKPAVGFDKEMQAKTKAMVSQAAIKKQQRLVKKQLRIQRRSERRHQRELKRQLSVGK